MAAGQGLKANSCLEIIPTGRLFFADLNQKPIGVKKASSLSSKEKQQPWRASRRDEWI